MKPNIGAAVLIEERILKEQRQDAGNGQTVLRDEVDLCLIAQAIEQILKPRERLRWELVPASSQQEEVMKFLNKWFRASYFIRQLLPFGTLNLPLHTTLVEVLKQGVGIRSQVERMEVELTTFAKRLPNRGTKTWTVIPTMARRLV